MRFILSLILILILGSCGCSKNCQPAIQIVEKTVTIREVVLDTTFTTAPDSSQAVFKLVADETTGSLKVEPLQSKPGRILNAPKVNIKDNILTVDCKSEADKLFAQWKVTYIDSVSKTTITLPSQPIDKPLTGFQKTLMWLGGAFILLVIIALILLLKRFWP